MSSQQVKILSIVGPGRSGSTLLAQILGETPGVLNVGELRWLWQRGIQEGRPCGCGLPPVECPQWSQVLLRLFGELPLGAGRSSAADRRVADTVAAQRRLARRSRRRPAIRSAAHDVGGLAGLQRVRSATEELVQAVTATTSARVIVDASKRPIDAAIFSALSSVDHFVVHLVRDPRAVAFSWGRSRELRTSNPAPDRMAQRTAMSSAVRWMENNLGCELLRQNVPDDRWLQLRYEDFIAAPEHEIGRVCTLLGESQRPPFHGGGAVDLSPNHTVAGNPSRFHTGAVRIRPDDEWRGAMTSRDKAIVTSLTLPLLRRYSYPVLADRQEGR